MPIINLVYEAPEVVTTAGIYHNATLGLISLSSDGSNWITIADKNLGATNVGDYGNYYQWGNNYGWDTNATTKSSSQVNAGSYGPGNYYNSSTFITGNASTGWDSSNNGNLRGGTTGTVEAMQGPCESGFHIPSYTEFSSLSTLLFTTFGLSKNGGTLNTYLKLPANGRIEQDGNIGGGTQGNDWWYFSSSNINARNAFGVYATDSNANLVTGVSKATGEGIRPFKNEPRPPYEGESGWTKLY